MAQTAWYRWWKRTRRRIWVALSLAGYALLIGRLISGKNVLKILFK